jgi:beta-mannosidase
MGDLSVNDNMTSIIHPLKTGWEFKEIDGDRVKTWLPVASVPTNVHIDLMANDM